MATRHEIENLQNLFARSYGFMVNCLEIEGLFREYDQGIELRRLLIEDDDLYFTKPIRSFEFAMANINGRRASKLSRVGLVGASLDYKLNLANSFLDRELTPVQLNKTLDVLISIFESLEKAFGLTIDPFIEALKIAKGLL